MANVYQLARTSLPLLLLGVALSLHAQTDCPASPVLNARVLNVNNLRAEYWNAGDMWFDGSNTTTRFPADAATSPLFSGGFWVSAYNADSTQLYTGAQEYGRSRRAYDYATGVIDPTTGEPAPISPFCNLSTVTADEIARHLDDLADGSLDDPIDNVLLWPGEGNTSGLADGYYGHELAPFVDANGNGVYEPTLGDYPQIAGDEAFWWAYHNDSNHPHTGSRPFGIELHTMVQARASSNPLVNGAHVFRATAINQSDSTFRNLALSFFLDPDIGCYLDDSMGSIPEQGTVYAYNLEGEDGSFDPGCPGTEYEGTPPIAALKVLEIVAPGPVDTGAVAWINPSNEAGEPSAYQPPARFFPVTWFNRMHNLHDDGTPIAPDAEFGYDPNATATTDWIYSGDANGFTDCDRTTDNDVKLTLNVILPGEFAPGERLVVDYALFMIEDVPSPCPDRGAIADRAAEVQRLFAGFVSSTEEAGAAFPTPGTLRLSPNPASETVSLSLEGGAPLSSLKVVDALGRTTIARTTETARIDVSSLPRGVYTVLGETLDGELSSARLVVER